MKTLILKAGWPGILLLVFIYLSPLQAEIYKWVDENGKTHYGDKPQTTDAEKIEIKDAPNADAGVKTRSLKQKRLLKVYDEERAEKKQNKAKLAAEKRKREENCRKAKKNLAAIRNASFIYTKSEDPKNPNVYSKEERQKITDGAVKKVDKWCK